MEQLTFAVGEESPTITPITQQSQELRVLLSGETDEWYTPPFYVDLGRKVLGTIDLDPASNPTAQLWVQAKRYYTKDDNGLRLPWRGKVWLNPPYCKTEGRSNQEIWSSRLIAEHERGNVPEAILLVKAALGYGWFKSLFRAWPCCLAYDLISFWSSESLLRAGGDWHRVEKESKPAKLGSAFFYFGPNFDRFKEVFSQIGKVIP